jgi:hypothetical protein
MAQLDSTDIVVVVAVAVAVEVVLRRLRKRCVEKNKNKKEVQPPPCSRRWSRRGTGTLRSVWRRSG